MRRLLVYHIVISVVVSLEPVRPVDAGGSGLSKGVVLYWNCDDDAGFGWRDNEWQKGGSARVAYDAKDRAHRWGALRTEGGAGRGLFVPSPGRPAPGAAEGAYVARSRPRR